MPLHKAGIGHEQSAKKVQKDYTRWRLHPQCGSDGRGPLECPNLEGKRQDKCPSEQPRLHCILTSRPPLEGLSQVVPDISLHVMQCQETANATQDEFECAWAQG